MRTGLGLHVPHFSAAFSPTDISGLVGWWDASNAASITESGGAVSQWNDLSGNANHLTQGTGANQPTTGTRTQNSKNVIDFDDSNDWMATSALALTQPFTLYGVVLPDATNYETLVSDQAGGNVYLDAHSSKFIAVVGTGSEVTGPAISGGTAYIVRYVIDGASTTITANNGTPVTSATGTGGISRFKIGAYSAGAVDPFNGWMAEWVVVNSAVSGGDDTSLWSYLNAKWAVY